MTAAAAVTTRPVRTSPTRIDAVVSPVRFHSSWILLTRNTW
jgi:hypothetical protein